MLPIQAIWVKRRLRYLKYSQHSEFRHKTRITRMLVILLGLIVLHSAAMVFFEKISLADAVWLSLTTVTTVGYGDVSASSTPGRLSSIILLYGIGIFLLAQLAAEFFEFRINVRDKKHNGTWRWNMKDHLLIINTPNDNTLDYLIRLVKQIRVSPELDDIPIQILTRKFDDGLPSSLTDQGVVHYSGIAENNDNLMATDINNASYIILLAHDVSNSVSDSMTLDVLTRIKEIGTKAFIVAEVTQDVNRQRMLDIGADAVIRPVRAYPEFPVRSLVAPGTEQVLENLFTHEDDHMVRYDVNIDGFKWADVVCRLMTKVGCLAIAFVNDQGVVDTNPLPDKIVNAKSLICLINQEQASISREQVADAFNRSAIES